MCEMKQETKNKLDRLIEAMDRLSQALVHPQALKDAAAFHKDADELTEQHPLS